MKKYWKTILISLVIVTTISSYYIQAAMASKNLLSLKIETTSGNKEEIENLMLEASYSSDGEIYRSAYITKDGSTDRRGQSLIEGLISSYGPLMFQNYIEQHRSFMRGKELYPGNYFEDESRLIYTNVEKDRKVIEGNPLTFNIDILDKNTNDNSSFEINTPAQASYHWIQVNDVYAENGEIKILATGYLINGGEELHIYTVDENNKELEHKKMIAKVESEGGVSSSIRIFNDFENIQNENYYLYMVEKYKHQTENGEYEIVSSQAYLYNNSTNEVKEWEIPAELAPFKELMVVRGADIFIPAGFELNRYNIEKEQWEEPINFNYPSIGKGGDIPFLQFTDEKLYLVDHVSDGYVFIISDLRTGETLYEGKIIVENGENINLDSPIYFEQLYIN